MFPCLRETVFQTRNINGGHSTTTLLMGFIHLSRVRSISSSTKNHSSSSSSSFAVSYLINSCGLSKDKAISASKIIHFETSSRPDSVLTLLETNGFTKPHISKLIIGRPTLLLANPDKTLKPKLEFFNSIGFSGLDLAKFLSTSNILQRSLENQIIPTFAFLKSIVHSDSNVITVLKRSSWVLQANLGKRMVPNIEILRDQGVPESNIKTLLKTNPRSLISVRFKEIVEEINSMGFNPEQSTFLSAIYVLKSMSKLTWEAKLNVYGRWGWSEDEIRSAFRKQPWCMMTSEKKITAIMNFLVNEMGFNASLVSEHPNVLLFSLEKRIIPRCRVIQVLVSKDMVKKKALLTYILTLSEKSFLNKYVIKYGKEFPGLLKVYQGQLDRVELTRCSEGVDKMTML